MIPEDTFISHLTHKLIRTVDADHASLAATIVGMCSNSEDGFMEISLDYLAGLFDDSVRTIQRRLQKLQLLNVISYESGDGRGNYCRFKKGDNYDTLSGIKGDKIDILSEQERVTNFAKKGDSFDAINNKRIIKGEDAHASARTSDPSSLLNNSKVQGDTPCDPHKINKSMKYPFGKFWKGYKVHPDFEYEEAACERMWSVMSDPLREDIMKTITARKPKEKNPYFFLYYYKPTSLRLAAIGTIVSRDDYYKFYGHDMPVDGWAFEKPEGYERYMFVKKGFPQ